MYDYMVSLDGENYLIVNRVNGLECRCVRFYAKLIVDYLVSSGFIVVYDSAFAGLSLDCYKGV